MDAEPKKDLAYYLGLNYPVTLVKEDAGYSVAILDLPGCLSQGDTLDEAMENIEDAKAGWLEVAMGQRFKIREPGTAEKPSLYLNPLTTEAENIIRPAIKVVADKVLELKLPEDAEGELIRYLWIACWDIAIERIVAALDARDRIKVLGKGAA